MNYELDTLRKVLNPSIKVNKLYLSYVARLFPEYKDSPSIILYKQQCTESLNNDPEHIDEDQTSKFDVTGSPLKYSFDDIDFEDSIMVMKQNWSKTEEKYLPLSRVEACDALNACIELIKKDAFPPIFALCNGEDKKKCRLLGTIIQGEWFTTIEVCSADTETFDVIKNSSSSILQQHLKLSHVQEYDVTVSAFNTFDLFGTKEEITNWDENVKRNFKGSLSIEVDTCNLSLYPSTRASKNNLIVQVVPGSKISPLKELWTQLLLLNQYLNIIEEYNKNVTSNISTPLEFPHDFTSPYKEEHGTIIRNLDLLLNEDYSYKNSDINDPHEMNFVNECLDNNLKIEQYIEQLPGRYNLDFTDLLWELLIKNTNYVKMTECIRIILEEIIINESSSQVNLSNSTRFAKIISHPNEHRIVSHLLSGSLPLEYVIDMGFTKLFRDYMYILINAGLVDLHDVDHKLGNVSCGEFTVDSYRKRLMYMVQIHVCLEFMLLIQNNLEYSTNDLKPLFLCAFKQYVCEESPIQNYHDLHQNILYSLNVPLPVSTIDNLNKEIPTTRRISLSSQSKLSKLTTIKYYSRLPLFPTIINPPDNLNEEYYVTNAICSSNKFK